MDLWREPPAEGAGQGGAVVNRMATTKVREILAMIEADGWYLVTIRGSHRQFRHPLKSGRVTIAGKPSDDVAPGTLNSILKQAGLKET